MDQHFLKKFIGVDLFILHFHVLEVVGPGLESGASHCLEDQVHLVNFRFSLEKHLPKDKLSKNAADRPNINCKSIERGPFQKFRGSVPKRDNLFGEGLGRIGDIAGQAEISKFKKT